MPIDTVFSLLCKAKDVVFFIFDHLEKLQLSEDGKRRIKDSLEYLQLTIKKIEPYIKEDSDTEEIKQFLTHLRKASESCASISEGHTLMKHATASSIISKLDNIEDEINFAHTKLNLFIDRNHLTMFCDAADFQNRALSKISILQENSIAGLNIVTDESVRAPPAPLEVTIKENKNKLILSWKPSRGTVNKSAMMKLTIVV